MAKTICSSGKETLEKHFLKVNDKTKDTFRFFSSLSTKYFILFLLSLFLWLFPSEAKTSFAKYCFEWHTNAKAGYSSNLFDFDLEGLVQEYWIYVEMKIMYAYVCIFVFQQNTKYSDCLGQNNVLKR